MSKGSEGTLVIVACGRSKIWGKDPDAGPTESKDAYTGSPFKLNRQYAERYGDHWVILSAKYGFIEPNYLLPGPYEVTFKRKSPSPIAHAVLRKQVSDGALDRFAVVIGLGGKEYRAAIRDAFGAATIDLQFPFAGLPIGKSMQTTKQAIVAFGE